MSRIHLVTALALLGTACGALGGGSGQDEAFEEIPDRFAKMEMAPAEPEPAMDWEGEAEEVMDGFADDAGGGKGYGGAPKPASAMRLQGLSAAPPPPPPPGAPPADNAEGSGERVREWFPESFLWQPRVETDAEGTATLDVTVPDQLTTWRVLALAHTREGQQAGAIHTFDSRLPVYVDPVVPGWMFAGDRLELPVQVVNTTSKPVESTLSVEATGSLSGTGVASVSLGARGSSVQKVELTTAGAGESKVFARLTDADAAERVIPVEPSGRPVRSRRGGSLAGPREFKMKSPTGTDASTQRLAVQVFPGPLAVLQAEVDRAATGAASPSQAAYGFALARSLTTLAARASTELDPKAVRRLRIVSWQRVVKHARSPNAGAAADILAAMRGVEDHELAVELEQRLVRVLLDGQRGGGDWARQSNAPMQQVLVQTAYAARVLPDDADGPRLRATGAIERFQRDIDDPYTAAVVLSAGLAGGELKERLQELLADAISTSDDGSRSISVPSGVKNPWGSAPSKAEMLAWAALATEDASVSGDLVAELMTGYDAAWGFGAYQADVIALEAVVSALPGISEPVEVVLSVDGQDVSRATLDPAQPKVPALLEARPAGNTGRIGLRVEPEVPGLAWVAGLNSWVPWTGDERMAGVEFEMKAEPMSVGRDSQLTLSLSAPSGTQLWVEQGLPAGTTIDEDALAGLSSVLQSHEVRQDRVLLTTRRFGAGEIIEIPLTVRPAFSGSFQTAPMSLARSSSESSKMYFAPHVWEVGG